MVRQLMCMIIVGLLFVGFFAGICSAENAKPVAINTSPNLKPKTYTPHAPIRINNDTDFNAQFPNRTISNLEINETGYGYCIYIGQCSQTFTIKNCFLHHASGRPHDRYYYDTGLYLYQISDGLIINNNCSVNVG